MTERMSAQLRGRRAPSRRARASPLWSSVWTAHAPAVSSAHSSTASTRAWYCLAIGFSRDTAPHIFTSVRARDPRSLRGLV